MNIKAERKEIIDMLNVTDDEYVIRTVRMILGMNAEQLRNWNSLTPEQQADFDEGLADLDAGRKQNFDEVFRELTNRNA